MSAAPPLPPMERLVALMFDAARGGRDDVIPALLQAGVDIEVTDERGFSPLVLASYNGHDTTTALLLAAGARPDGRPEFDGNSALAGVAFKGYAQIARRLIEAGADVNRRNAAGQTPLMTAALFGQIEIVEMMLSAGADPAAKDSGGNTPISVAQVQGNEELVARLEAAIRG